MFSILNRALSWAITSFGNKFCLKRGSRLIKALNNRFFVKFMQLEIGLLFATHEKVEADEPHGNWRITVVQSERKTKLTIMS